MFKELMQEICEELDIKYTILSNNWVIKLEKNNRVKYLSGNKFDINGHASGNIMDDKYATYEMLNDLDIPVCKHHIFYRRNNRNNFAKGCHTKNNLLKLFNKYNQSIIVKPNRGSKGIGVYHITNQKELLKVTNQLFKNNYSISVCPYYEINNEYRVIVLDNQVKLIYKKVNPLVIGDGINTLKELLVKFNKSYYSHVVVPDIVPKKGEKYQQGFKFNLSRGSIATTDIDEKLKQEIENLAKMVTTKTGIRFASVDIIETASKQLLVLEVNSGVTINKATEFIENGRSIAKEIYKEAVIKMFNE